MSAKLSPSAKKSVRYCHHRAKRLEDKEVPTPQLASPDLPDKMKYNYCNKITNLQHHLYEPLAYKPQFFEDLPNWIMSEPACVLRVVGSF